MRTSGAGVKPGYLYTGPHSRPRPKNRRRVQRARVLHLRRSVLRGAYEQAKRGETFEQAQARRTKAAS
jgi:hypothetical protein